MIDESVLIEQALRGKTGAEMAAFAGASIGTIRYRLRKLMLAGRIPRAHERKMMRHSARRRWEKIRSEKKVNWGRMDDIVRKLTTEQVLWLVEQVPEGANVGQVIAALIVDAYSDEEAKQRG